VAVLGIEGTAHTLGVGLVEADPDRPGRGLVLANERAMLRPAQGGIHPREAANHHAEMGPTILAQALEKAGVAVSELDGVAFSQGPGLGPCLRVAATMARALSISIGRPLLGVNHCVAHLEAARGLTAAQDPLLLYASGANTQIIALARGRYRVFGETLDVGIGNALDKFAREQGIAFPGGPEIERLAAAAPRDAFHELPYSVKGMDMSFAGLATAAARMASEGVPLPEVCQSLQEHAFAALVETAERALSHTGKAELAMGGGVACNARLQEMAKAMCEARDVAFHCPPRDLLVDNGAMIAWNGLQKLQAGDTVSIEGSAVMPYQRTDQVDVSWRARDSEPSGAAAGVPGTLRGAEAVLEDSTFMGKACIAKRRVPKTWRHARLDERLRSSRTRDETALLVAARRAGVPVPVVYDTDATSFSITMEKVRGSTLRAALSGDDDATAIRRLQALGLLVARLHDAGVTHGDLTTSNVMVPDASDTQSLVLLDLGLGVATEEVEPRGVDLHLMEEALEATEARAARLAEAFFAAYKDSAKHGDRTLARLAEIRERGRYR
jgi:N6-L-threonylcarbamoyladenine synthase/protein kinase Bud32